MEIYNEASTMSFLKSSQAHGWLIEEVPTLGYFT